MELSVLQYLIRIKQKVTQQSASNEFGWYRMFNRNRAENNTQVAPNTSANILPFSASIAFQTTTMVNAPNNPGKNRIQNNDFPNHNMIVEIQDVTGGTDKYPHAK